MIENNCNHNWIQEPISGDCTCVLCNRRISSSELLQLETLNNNKKSVENQTRLANH